MNRTSRIVCSGVSALAALVASFSLAQSQGTGTAQDTGHQLPPGWTEADMMACIEAGTPGAMHAHLASSAGTWTMKTKMWMAPGTEPMQGEGIATFTMMMEGRYLRCEMSGDLPGMGPFNGFGIYGFDNVSQQFQSTWVDNHSTGLMQGTGQLASDGSRLSWKHTYNCPVTKKATTIREIEYYTGPDSRRMEMFGIEPKSGKEFKMMEAHMTRKRDGAARVTAPTGTMSR